MHFTNQEINLPNLKHPINDCKITLLGFIYHVASLKSGVEDAFIDIVEKECPPFEYAILVGYHK